MADLTYEILTDRTKFPDEQEMTLASGEKVTVKQFRDSLIPKADFTKQTETWARKERDLQANVEGLNSQLALAIQAREAAASALNSRPASATTEGGYTEDQILQDPLLGPMMKRLQAAEQAQTAHAERIKLHEDTWLKNQYVSQLATIEGRWNGRYNADGKGTPFDKKAFLDRVIETQTTNLDLAFDAFSRPAEIDAVRKESEARGVEKGRAAARVPVVPIGRRSARPTVQGLKEGDTLQDLTDDMVLADEEIQSALRGELPNEGRG